METKKIRNGGFTLLETLLTVAILVILLGVSAVGVVRYIDYLDITELDNAARDIYMAAENRAVLMQNSGASVVLLSTGGGGSDPVVLTNTELKEDSKRDLLPAGTIDPALWNGDFRVVYDKGTGHVKEVFYAEEGTIPSDPNDLGQLRNPSRSERIRLFRSVKDNNIDCLVGYYGSDVGEAIGTKPLPTPGVEVFIDNGEELTLTVRFTLPEGVSTVDVTGMTKVTATPSVKLYYPTGSTTPIKSLEPVLTFSGNTATYEMVLDSLESGKQFKDLKSGLTGKLGDDFTVTAELKLSAVADGYIDSAYNATGTDNSLFAKGSTYNTADGTAKIANLRHLQNLCTDFSKVGSGITEAEQLNDIDCRGAESVDTRYAFIPIENTNLTSYNGKNGDVNTHINNLYVKQSGAAAGLFGKVSTNLKVQNTRVCWTRPDALVDGTDYVYAVSGTNAGGLIGAITNGTVKIENSFAATTVRGTATAGGLVGTQTGGTLTIDRSYADCCLSGKNAAGGLVGSKTGGTLTIDRSYAAGFITDGKTTAGLVNGTVDTATHCYSVVRVIQKDTDGKETLKEPATPMYTDWDKDTGSAFYLSSPADVTEDQLGNAFEYTNADNSPETHVYNLRYKLSSKAEDALTPPYPFPGLKNLPHYGDWAELNNIPTPPPVGLAYYERYSPKSGKDGVYGLEGVYKDVTFEVDDENVKPIYLDGYALVVLEEGYGESAPIEYTVAYGVKHWTWKRNNATWTNPESVKESFTVKQDNKTYHVFPLPDEVFTGAPANADSFYQELEISRSGVAASQTFYFNPHFAKTVHTGGETAPSSPTDVDHQVYVRTPRHLYDLSVYSDTYAPMGLYYGQELDLDYNNTYSWEYDMKPTKEGSVYLQAPIGLYDSKANAFTGTYDGGGKKIENVVYDAGEANHYFGLFGSVGYNEYDKDDKWTGYVKGTLKNINYITGGRTVNAAGDGDVHVGTLAAYVTEITNCTVQVEGSLDFSGNGAGIYGGGLAGYAKNMTGCTATVTGDLTVRVIEDNEDKNETSTYAGGLVGYADADVGVELTECTATVTGTVDVTGTGSDTYGGGLAGRVRDGYDYNGDWDFEDENEVVITVSKWNATIGALNVSGSGGYIYGGGLMGYAGIITNCDATITGDRLTVDGNGSSSNAYVGGLSGGAYGSVTDCSVVAPNAALEVTGNGKQITERDTGDEHPKVGNVVYGGGLVGNAGGTVSGCDVMVDSLEVTGHGVFAYGGGLVGCAKEVKCCTADDHPDEPCTSEHHTEVKNIKKLTVTGAGSETNAYGGGLAGHIDLNVKWCSIESGELVISVAGCGQDVYGGGLVGRTYNTISNCSAEIKTLNVTENGGDGEYGRYAYGSGLVGYASSVTSCDAIVRTGIKVEGKGDNTRTYGAGLVGWPVWGVTSSTALVKSLSVEGYGPTTAAGGLVAYTASPLTNCAAGVGTLEVTGAGYDTYGAGLAGHASGKVEKCEAATDSLEVTGPEKIQETVKDPETGEETTIDKTFVYAGGLVGSSVKGSVNLSYAMGRISMESTRVDHVGGLVGYSEGTITDSYAAVDVPSITGANCGGLVGQILEQKDEEGKSINVTPNSYWLKGTFRYRGEYYTMTGSGLTDSENSITPAGLAGQMSGMITWNAEQTVCKPVDDLPATGEPWMAEYRGTKYPYPRIVTEAVSPWRAMHYGLWPIEKAPDVKLGDEAKSPILADIKGNTYYYWDEAIGRGEGMPVFEVRDGKCVCVGWMINCKFNEGNLVEWTLTTDKAEFGVSARAASYAADPAPLDAALPEPAARPAEPDPKSKDETDPNP